MRHSASPRSMSTRRNVKRPAWSAERRLQRATSRTGPSVSAAPLAMCCILGSHGTFVYPRSEEHTSELQSQSNLVCRLLLEKKKKNNVTRTHNHTKAHGATIPTCNGRHTI